MRGHFALPEKVRQSVCFFLAKGANIIIFNSNLIQKGICRQTSMEKFKLENNTFGTFCACSCKLKCFFPIHFFLIKVAISVPFICNALGFHSLLQRDSHTLNCWVFSFFGKLS